MKNKGFTIIELAVSFCMVAAISITLFQLVFSMRDLYLSGNIKTTLLNKQGILTKRIYDDLNTYMLESINSCGLSCLEFKYDKKAAGKKTAQLSVDPYNVSITYDNYTVKLDNGSYIGNIDVENNSNIYNSTSKDNSILNIKIPIYNKLVDGNYGLDITHQYNNNPTTVNTTMTSDIKIKLDNQEIDVEKIDNNYFAKIFFHNKYGIFTSKDNFLKNNGDNNFSALYALNLFKGKYKPGKDIELFEFVLKYPNFNETNSNHWYQESNFLKEYIKGFEPIDIAWNEKGKFNGLNLINENECGFVNMTSEYNNNCNMILGKKNANNGFNFSSDSNSFTSNDIALYIRIDDYIDKYALSNY